MSFGGTCLKSKLRTGHIFIAWAGGEEDFGEDYLIFRTTKGGITENFGRIQRGHHSNLLGK